jgi:thiopurine S-methyltransferase
MEANFWLKKWDAQDIAFHQAEANPLLAKHFNALSLRQGSRVFVPLCGKTLDIAWLLATGYSVVGAELSETAIVELFDELGVKPDVVEVGNLKHYAAENIDMFVGDIFELSSATLGAVDAIYDRAALVALPDDMRRQYANHLIQLTTSAPQFVICFEYDQNLMAGPPFSVDANEIAQLYSAAYHLSVIESVEVAGGLKGVCAATETVWLLLS